MTASRAAALALGLALACVPSCGRGDPKPAVTDGSAMQGRAVSGAGQLHAAWMAVTDGELDGVEFLKDGQAIVTAAMGRGTMTLSFKVLENGRLSLATSSGQTTVYKSVLAKDVLELTREQPAPGAPQRFARLRPGQSLADGLRAHQEKMDGEMRERVLALRDLIVKGDTVLVPDEGQGVDWVMALEFEDPQSSINGRLVLVESPRKPDPLSPVRVLPTRGETAPADRRTSRVSIAIDAGPAAEPGGQQGVAGPVRLTIDGPPDRPVITGTAHLRSLWPEPVRVTLKRDAKTHAAALAALRTQREAITQEMDRMAGFLGARAVLAGRRTVLGSDAEEPVSVVIERAGPGGGYEASVSVGARVDQPARAGVDMLLGRAALYVVMPWGEQWRLQTADADGVLAGLWRPHANTDFISHGDVELTVERRWSAEEVEAERTAVERYLTEDLRSPRRFVGFIQKKYGALNTTRWPVSVEIQTQADGSVRGSAWMIAQRGGVELAGTITGRDVSLDARSVLDGSEDFDSYARQRWRLSFTGLDPEPGFAGEAQAGNRGGGRVVLAPATPEAFAARREQLLAAVSGVRYAARTTDTSAVRDYGTYFVFDPASDSGEVTADVVGDGSLSEVDPPARFVGRVVDDHGLPVLKGLVTPAPDIRRGEDGKPYEITLSAFEADGAVHLAGSTPPGPRNQSWFILTPLPDGAGIVMDPVRAARLAAARLGATAEIPSDPKPGDRALVVVQVTERDQKVGQLFYADGRYTHRNSVPAAAIHAGLAVPGEVCVLRLTYGPPLVGPVEAVEGHGVTSSRATFRENNPLPSFTIERVSPD